MAASPLLINGNVLDGEAILALCDLDSLSNRMLERKLTPDQLLGLCLINNVAPRAGFRDIKALASCLVDKIRKDGVFVYRS